MAVTLLIALGAGTVSVVMGILLVGWLFGEPRRDRRPNVAGSGAELETLSFLFQHQRLADATGAARALLDILPGDSDWQRLMGWLAMRLPDASCNLLDELARNGRVELSSTGTEGRARIRAIFEDLGEGLIRVTLSDPSSGQSGTIVDSLTLAAMEEEIDMLRSTVDNSPMLAWREDESGRVTWANSAYLKLAEGHSNGETVWPLPRLIQLPPSGPQPLNPRRAQIDDGGETRWFECHGQSAGDQGVAIALPADAAVRAERSLREFVQTLTKTFADLPIGMAIFDRGRNLQLFNPALIDLTGLSAGFLTARPTLYAFLDRLREARMVPEPKDYRTWRARMNTLESAAASGHHVETWSLPGGQTYRVTGRPHPDGAVAFLFEDITSEISLTRKFRADLSLGREVLDALDDAVAVFAGNGQLVSLNSAYARLWGQETPKALAGHLAIWQSASGAGPGLQKLRDALEGARSDLVPGEALTGAMAGPSGQLLGWSLRNLSGARVLIRFDIAAPVPVRAQAASETVTGDAETLPVEPETQLARLLSAKG